MAANQLRSASVLIGYPAVSYSQASTLALSATATWLAMQFVLDQTKTLNAVKLFLNTLTGTPAASECTLDIYSDASGIPSASVEGPISAAAVPASGNWMTWSGLSGSYTAGTPYWCVWKNTNASPGSHFPTYRYHDGAARASPLGDFSNSNLNNTIPMFGWNKVHTLNSGTAWASGPASGVGGLRLGFSDSTYDGFPIQTSTRPSSGTTGDRAFGTQEVGVRFNVPAGATWNVRGAAFPIIKTSTPGNLRYRLYQGVTLMATSLAVPATNIVTANGDWYSSFFSSAVAMVSTNNPYRIVFGDATAGDANTVGYNTQIYAFENDAPSLALKPMNGTVQKTITADNTAGPVVFSDTATDVLPFALLLDTLGELTGASGGIPTFGAGSPFFRGA